MSASRAAAAAGSPWQACLYQQAMSIRNAVLQRLRRLKQPKYLAGAVVGAGYFYFVLFRRGFSGGQHHGVHVGGVADAAAVTGWLHQPAIAPLVLAAAAAALLVALLLTWVLPGQRSALSFTEAEVAFLFPAPMTRSQLVRYKLLRSQLAILVSSILLTVVLRRGGALGGNPWLHALGWWMVLSTVRMHNIGASFARERLRGGADAGARGWLRDSGFLVVLVAVGVAAVAWVRTHVPPPQADALLPWAQHLLALPGLSWVLWPTKLVVAPVLAADASMFWRAAPGALIVMALHFLWIVRSDASFEEAAIAQAQRHAHKIDAMRDGRSPFSRGPAKARPAPFALAPTGFPAVALLWRNLIVLGTRQLRAYFGLAAALLLFEAWVAHDPHLRPLLKVFFGVGLGIGGWLFLVGPMFVQRSLQRVLPNMDVLKGTPLPGWQIALGELLSPMLLLSLVEWLLLAVVFLAALAGGLMAVPAWTLLAAAIGLALLVAPLCGLLLCLPFAGVLLFPAWTRGGQGRGVEVMGQRMIFFGAYLLVLVVTLLPALLVGGVVFGAVYWAGGLGVALLPGAVVVAAVLVLELMIVVRWLGRRVERFDLSQERS